MAYQCDFCSFRSNYKYNVNRHIKTVHQTSNDETSITQIPGGPVQALNLSNNINVPDCPPSQVINIQPPAAPATPATRPKKTVIHRGNQEHFDIRLKENFKLFISGPSRSGKTVFVKELIENLDIFAKAPPQLVTVVYKVFQPIYNEMNVDHVLQDGPNLKQRLFNIANGQSMLVIFDDMINSNSLGELSDLFMVDGRHMNLSMIFISQKMFVNNEDFREISRNCDYYAVFKNPRDAREIRTLASQMTPGKMELVSYYKEATQSPFSYLLINITQECQDEVKYLSHLFHKPHVVNAYFDGKMKELTDGLREGNTNFGKMHFKSANFPLPPSNNNDDDDDDSLDFGGGPTSTDYGFDPPSPPNPPNDSVDDHDLQERLRRLREEYEYNERRDVERSDASVGPERRNMRIGTDPIRMGNASVGHERRDVAIDTDNIPVRNAHVGPERRNVRIGTDPIRMGNASVGHERRDVAIETDNITMGNALVGPERRDVDIGTDPIPMRHALLGPERRNVSIGMDPIPMGNASVGPERRDVAIDADNIPMRHALLGPERRDVDIGTDPIPTGSERPAALPALPAPEIPRAPYPPRPAGVSAVQGLSGVPAAEVPAIQGPSGVPAIQGPSGVPAIQGPSGVSAIQGASERFQMIRPTLVQRRAIQEEPMETNQRPYESARPERVLRLNAPLEDMVRPRLDGGSRIECPKCLQQFESSHALLTHNETCDPTNHSCLICGKNFQSRHHLTGHVRAMHESRRFTQGKMEKMERNRMNHRNVFPLSREFEQLRMKECRQCKKYFYFPIEYWNHIDNDEVCGRHRYRAYTKQVLDDDDQEMAEVMPEVPAMHEVTPQDYAQCPICKEYIHVEEFRLHRDTCQGLSFICTICNRNFNRKEQLESHMKKRHQNE